MKKHVWIYIKSPARVWMKFSSLLFSCRNSALTVSLSSFLTRSPLVQTSAAAVTLICFMLIYLHMFVSSDAGRGPQPRLRHASVWLFCSIKKANVSAQSLTHTHMMFVWAASSAQIPSLWVCEESSWTVRFNMHANERRLVLHYYSIIPARTERGDDLLWRKTPAVIFYSFAFTPIPAFTLSLEIQFDSCCRV